MHPIIALAPLLLGGSHGHTSIFAIPVSMIAAFVLGGLWYSPLLFLKPWKRLLGIPPEAKGNPVKPMLINIVMLGVAAVGMFFLAQQVELDDWLEGLLLGLAVGIAFVATAIGTTYAYQGRSFKLWLIDATFQVLCLMVMGTILGAWHN